MKTNNKRTFGMILIRTGMLLLCSIACFATPAAAKPHHRHLHAGISHHRHVASTDVSSRRRVRVAHRHHRGHFRVARAASMEQTGFFGTPDRHGISPGQSTGGSSGGFSMFGGGGVVAEARRYIGGNPTGRGSLWCAAFMNLVLERSGHRGSGSNMARSFASYGTRVSGPQVGAIAVMSRGRRGGHVGVVSGIDANGNPIIISGNHGRRVAESVYQRGRIYAYVMPN